jgi:UDP-N-acetylglucosamine 2-epimerase (non-hydrolysing)
MKKILFIFGTRPEAIKMAPLIKEFEKHADSFSISICLTGQHKDMLKQVTDFFLINEDYNLELMKPNQTLFDITSEGIKKIKNVLDETDPDITFVQGDTTTVLVGALGSFYCEKKVAHLEAGLRSFNKYSPFPEEMNRRLVSHIADYHFAPTKLAVENLINEGIAKYVWNVGNTVIDALFLGLDIIKNDGEKSYQKHFELIDFNKKIILITGHRRESFGIPFENICNAIKEIALKFKDVELVYPVHLNPNVRKPVNEFLNNIKNVHLIEPVSYPYFIWLMNKCNLILTDSGGIQEEGPSLGKPVLVMRDVTERTEGIDAGTAKLVGTDKDNIVNEITRLLTDNEYYLGMANAVNPYGDGHTSKKIIEILMKL